MARTSVERLLHSGDTQAVVNTRIKNSILSLNDETEKYGLRLTETQARELVSTRNRALHDNARYETGLGAVGRIIEEFAQSEYITPQNYADTINELTEIFYYIKSESDDKISDDKLLALMKRYFEKTCAGSLELLRSRDLEAVLRLINRGEDFDSLGSDDDYSDMTPPDDYDDEREDEDE